MIYDYFETGFLHPAFVIVNKENGAPICLQKVICDNSMWWKFLTVESIALNEISRISYYICRIPKHLPFEMLVLTF